jgi:hypothetical protein
MNALLQFNRSAFLCGLWAFAVNLYESYCRMGKTSGINRAALIIEVRGLESAERWLLIFSCHFDVQRWRSMPDVHGARRSSGADRKRRS